MPAQPGAAGGAAGASHVAPPVTAEGGLAMKPLPGQTAERYRAGEAEGCHLRNGLTVANGM